MSYFGGRGSYGFGRGNHGRGNRPSRFEPYSSFDYKEFQEFKEKKEVEKEARKQQQVMTILRESFVPTSQAPPAQSIQPAPAAQPAAPAPNIDVDRIEAAFRSEVRAFRNEVSSEFEAQRTSMRLLETRIDYMERSQRADSLSRTPAPADTRGRAVNAEPVPFDDITDVIRLMSTDKKKKASKDFVRTIETIMEECPYEETSVDFEDWSRNLRLDPTLGKDAVVKILAARRLRDDA